MPILHPRSLHLPGALCAVALAFAHPAATLASSNVALGFDLLKVLNVAYYPLQVMSYCFKEVSPNTAFQSAGNAWNQRNADLLKTLEAKAKEQHISNDLRVAADKDTLAAITKTVASQPDRTGYCKLIMSLVDGGQFDLAIREDIKDPLKRILAAP